MGRRTNNDVEGFNKQLNKFLTSPKPSLFKFIDHIKKIDSSMSLKALEYRSDPLDYACYSKSTKTIDNETRFVRL